jgi:hypothetical protein
MIEGAGVVVGTDVLCVSGVADGCDLALDVEAAVGAAGESSACWMTPTVQPSNNG